MIRRLLAAYAEHEDLLSIGAYRRGSNRAVDAAVDMRESIEELFRQRVDQELPWDQVVGQLQAIGAPVPSQAERAAGDAAAAAPQTRRRVRRLTVADDSTADYDHDHEQIPLPTRNAAKAADRPARPAARRAGGRAIARSRSSPISGRRWPTKQPQLRGLQRAATGVAATWTSTSSSRPSATKWCSRPSEQQLTEQAARLAVEVERRRQAVVEADRAVRVLE